MTEPQTQVDPNSEIISELSRHVANLKKENAEWEHKYNSAMAIAGAASVNADSLRQFGFHANCNVCSFAAQNADGIVGTMGTGCKECGAVICLECNGHDRSMWRDMQHTCKTCKNAILCDCETICDVCNGSTTNAGDAKRKERSAGDVRAATWVMTGEAEVEEKSEPAAKKRALNDDDNKDK